MHYLKNNVYQFLVYNDFNQYLRALLQKKHVSSKIPVQVSILLFSTIPFEMLP